MKIINFLFLFVFVTFVSVTHADDPKAIAEKHVKDAVEFAKKNGKDAAITEINKGKFRDGEVYVTLYDMEGKCVAHPTKPARVGQNLINDKDPDGKFFVKERVEIAKKGSGWQTYKFQNPETKKMELKEVYNEGLDGIIFSAGAYTK